MLIKIKNKKNVKELIITIIFGMIGITTLILWFYLSTIIHSSIITYAISFGLGFMFGEYMYNFGKRLYKEVNFKND